MLHSEPPLTVLLAVYNGQTYLREAVDSVLAQSFRDFEFIIIDDGSSDRTLSILREYEANDSRIRLVSRPNKGLTNTLNEGLSLARGEFLARMDADDVCMPDRFEKQVAYLREHPECVLVGARVQLMDPKGLPIRIVGTETEHEQIDSAHLARRWPVVHPAVTMRMSALRQVGGYRDIYNTLEDLDLFLRLAEVGRLANLPDLLLRYRQHFASITHSKEGQQLQIRQAIYDETRARRGLPPESATIPVRTRPRTRSEQHRYWAWAALKAGNVKTARKHALRTLRLAPLSKESWRVVVCAARGH
jgi:glycosyltransferase involved in cell wall biosynthesis